MQSHATDIPPSRAGRWPGSQRVSAALEAVRNDPGLKKLFMLTVVAGVLLIVFVSSLIFSQTILRTELLRTQAEVLSDVWATQFQSQIADIAGLANGRPPTAAEIEQIETVSKAGAVFRFKLFDRNGDLRLVSDDSNTYAASGEKLAEHNVVAARVIRSKLAHIELKDGRKKSNRPDFYSEAYQPIIVDGKIAGVIEVYLDNTDMHAHYGHQAYRTSFGVSLLIGFLFAVPALAFFVRSEQAHDARKQIQHIAYNDAVTGIANRAAFQTRLSEALANRAPGNDIGLLYLDLDHFKGINDTMGHDVGDIVLQCVSQRIKDNLRHDDFVARIGGDEFGIIVPYLPVRSACISLAERIQMALSAPIDTPAGPAFSGVSIGIATTAQGADTPTALMKKADIALFEAKAGGRSRFRIFSEDMEEALVARRQLELDLKEAIEDNQLSVHYQPIMAIDGPTISSFEALVRWQHPEKGIVPPLDFIPLAEETGLVNDIGRFVLHEACSQAQRWPNDISVAINVSPVQVLHGSIVQDVRDVLARTGLEPERLSIEVTESVFLEDQAKAGAILEELTALGVRISMDDFGTGYSSLSYLHAFPFHKVKVDKSFTHKICASESALAVIRAVIGLCDSLGKISIIEGVETDEQLQLLREEGCARVQGYYFAKPMTADEAVEFMRTSEAASAATRS